MNKWSGIFKNITLVTQFGLSLVMPLLLCLGLCWWLTTRFSIGGWIFIPGFFFGLGGSASVALQLYKTEQRKHEKKKQKSKEKISFNRH